MQSLDCTKNMHKHTVLCHSSFPLCTMEITTSYTKSLIQLLPVLMAGSWEDVVFVQEDMYPLYCG